tara:strand:- start:576 stop:1079 length:504 start_codon:yes stop_codon:yes gene_type:complete
MCKQAKELTRLLRSNGCDVEITKGGHMKYKHRKTGEFGYYSSTSSDVRAIKTAKARLKRQGIIASSPDEEKVNVNKETAGYLISGTVTLPIDCLSVWCPNVSEDEITGWMSNPDNETVVELLKKHIEVNEIDMVFSVREAAPMALENATMDEYEAVYVGAAGYTNAQ